MSLGILLSYTKYRYCLLYPFSYGCKTINITEVLCSSHRHSTVALLLIHSLVYSSNFRYFVKMFSKVFAVATALVGAGSMLTGAAALPANITESAIAARAIDPAGTHTGQVCSYRLTPKR